MSLLGRAARLIASPWAPAVRGVLHKLPEFQPPLMAPGPIAKVTHARAGAPPRWVRRHARQINGDQSRRRCRKARARYLRLAAAVRVVTSEQRGQANKPKRAGHEVTEETREKMRQAALATSARKREGAAAG